jgi:hypothetical protein
MAGAFRRVWGRVARLGRGRASAPTAGPSGDFQGILAQHEVRRSGQCGAPRIFKAPGLVDVPPLYRQPGPTRRSANPTGANFITAEHPGHWRSYR